MTPVETDLADDKPDHNALPYRPGRHRGLYSVWHDGMGALCKKHERTSE